MAGVISRGIQGPIIREGDDIVDIVVNSVYASEKEDNYTLKDRDVIAVTESVVARAQGTMSLWIRLPRISAINSPPRSWVWFSPSSAATGSPCALRASPGHGRGGHPV